MAAGLGFKTFTTGEVLTAGDVNGYLMQGINVFATTTARNAAITAPAEGQFAFTKDTNSLWYYDGAAWVASGATGDIEGVTAGVGISGGGTSGTVTITNSMATEIAAKGDLIAGTGSQTFDNLTVGANNTVLTADSSTATGLKWATPTISSAMTQISDTTLGSAAADITFSSIPSTYNHLKLVISGASASASFNGAAFYVQVNGDTGGNYAFATVSKYAGSGATMTLEGQFSQTQFELGNIWVGQAVTNAISSIEMTFMNYKGTTLRKGMTFIGGGWSDAPGTGSGSGAWKSTSAITSIKLYSNAGNFMTGTRATLYGWT